AERRRKAAERRAKVILYPDAEGTASLTGQNLPGVRAAAAFARITALAQALKATGADGGIDLLRSKVLLGLLLGTLPHIPPPPDGPVDPDCPPDPGDSPGSGPAGDGRPHLDDWPWNNDPAPGGPSAQGDPARQGGPGRQDTPADSGPTEDGSRPTTAPGRAGR